MEGPLPVCINCKHFNIEKWDCLAFPDGIPPEIVVFGDKHSEPLLDQENDIVFTPIEN